MTVRLTCLFAAAVLLSPSTVLAQTSAAQGPSGLRGGVFLGIEDDVGPAGFALRVDGEMPQKPLAPAVGLSIVGSIGYARWSDDGSRLFNTLGSPFFGTTYGWSTDVNVFRFIPAVRFNFGRSPKLRPYADAGIGLAYATYHHHYEWPEYIGYPVYAYQVFSYDVKDSEFSLAARLAGGLALELSDQMAIVGEVGFGPNFGNYYGDTVDLMVGATFRM